MVDCPSELTKIRYREKGKDWIYVDGDDYVNATEAGKCLTNYVVSGQVYGGSTHHGTCGKLVLVEAEFYGKFVSVSEVDYNRDRALQVTYKDAQSQLQAKYLKIPDTSFIAIGVFPCSDVAGANYLYIKDSLQNVNIQRTDGQADNCGDCILTITKNGKTIFKKSFDECPEVEKYCQDDCPPWTCKPPLIKQSEMRIKQ